MIGKPEWFTPRKFGWGVGIRSKEGIAYVIGISALFGIAANLPIALEQRVLVFGALVALVVADIISVMPKVYANLDEREQKHQLLAERNASFVAVASVLCAMAYVSYTQIAAGPGALPVALLPLIGVLVAMAIAKGATLLYLEKEA